MTKREREARRWWRQAHRDLESAEINLREQRCEVTCFLAQQAAEKAVKALLYAQGESPVLGHSLLGLTQRAAEYVTEMAALREAAKTLDGYYVPSRYPNGLTDEVTPGDFFDRSDGERGLTAARSILEAVAAALPVAVTRQP
jgi:HEPN domain-containing protein